MTGGTTATAIALGTTAAVSAGASAYGSSKAASAQEKAANNATNAQRSMFDVTQQNLEPYNTTGQNALQRANDLAGTFNFNPTMAQLSQTPGYQFTNNQGLKSVQNAAAARGLGTSGAALKAAAQYSTGLANNTYQNQFNNALSSYQTNLGGLQNIANLGENAAAGVGNAATQTGGQFGSNIIGAGNAAAAGYNTAAGAVGNAGNSAVSGYLTNNLIQGLYANPGQNINSGGAISNAFDNANNQYSGMTFSTSDILTKENILPMGEENGFNIYEFNYIGNPIKYIGVIAQEIMNKMPEAVKRIGGYLAVDYNKIGVKFKRIS